MNTPNNLDKASNTTESIHSDHKTYPCPNCKKETKWQDNPYKPFCSDRCKLIDFGAWANEDYRVPAEDSPFSQDLD